MVPLPQAGRQVLDARNDAPQSPLGLLTSCSTPCRPTITRRKPLSTTVTIARESFRAEAGSRSFPCPLSKRRVDEAQREASGRIC